MGATRAFASVFAGVVLLGAAATASAQNVVHLSDETVFAGDPVQVSATVDTAQEIFGFTFGVRHNAAFLTVTGAAPGAALTAMNGGAGPEYFLVDTVPANGPGMFIACLFDLGPLDNSLLAGTGQEVATIDYTTSAGAAPGSTQALTLAADLGNPEVIIAFSTGATIVPATDDGSVTFDVPAPTGTTCTLVDPCACDFTVSWSNPTTYTSIEVRVDGVLTQTLAGTATSTALTLGPLGNSSTVDVRGVVGALSSADDSCVATCPTIATPALPSGLTCTIASSDAVAGCTVDVSWALGGTYNSITVLVDGSIASILGGTATSDTVSLPVSATPQQICLEVTDECGAAVAGTVCCDVTCFPGVQFIRGDCNADNGFDISDPISLLGILFSGTGPALCDDACDGNDDGGLDISDAIYILGSLFSGGAAPPAPFPGCGLDGTDTDALDCASFPPC